MKVKVNFVAGTCDCCFFFFVFVFLCSLGLSVYPENTAGELTHIMCSWQVHIWKMHNGNLACGFLSAWPHCWLSSHVLEPDSHRTEYSQSHATKLWQINLATVFSTLLLHPCIHRLTVTCIGLQDHIIAIMISLHFSLLRNAINHCGSGTIHILFLCISNF